MKTHKIKNESVYDLIHTISTAKKNHVKINDISESSNDVFHIDTSSFSFEDIVLPNNLQKELSEVISEYTYKDDFISMNLLPTNKILLEWYPWCGKTMIAYILSNLLWRELKVVNLSKIVSSHLWETAWNLSNIFNRYNDGKHILFIDEFDILWRLRWDTNNEHNEMKRIVNSLLQLIDYFPSDWFLIFATNDLEIIDKALLRRMDKIVNVPLPNKSSIMKFLWLKITKYSTKVGKIDYEELSKKFEGHSYAHIDRALKNSIKSFVISQRDKWRKTITITNSAFKEII